MNATATKVNATYRTISEYMNVLTNIPGTNDPHMRFISGHEIILGGETTPIPSHYRRGDLINRRFLTRNFFIDPTMVGEKIQKMVVNIAVIEKTDHSRNNQRTLILDIRPVEEYLNLEKAEWLVSLNSPTGDTETPNTGRFISFKKRI